MGPDNPPQVLVRPAAIAERPLIEGLFQLYAYDWSEMEPPASDAFEVDARGRFADYPDLDAYWREKDRWPLLIEIGGRIAGFALINTLSHRGAIIDRNMAEFFIVRKHRRRGAAASAVQAMLRAHPGRWEIAIAQRNTAARALWPKAIASAEQVSGLHAVEGDGTHWRGPIWCFHAASPTT